MARPKVVDLFAGAGGLSLGFEQAGFDVAVAVEYDPIHAAIHELNFPEAKVICRDVRKLTGREILASANLLVGDVDVVIGGPPCQGFSLIGHRVLDDPRNELVFHFLRLVREIRPRVFVMENVPGMASGGHTELLNELIQQFEEAGYSVRQPYRLLNAAAFAVPQERRRLFLLGARLSTELPDYPKPSTVSSRTPDLFSLGLGNATTVEDAIGDLPEVDEYDELLSSDELRVKLRGGSKYAQRLRGELRDSTDFSYPRSSQPTGVLSGLMRAEHTALSRQRFGDTQPGTTEPVSRFFKLAPDGLCNTLRAGTASDRGAFSAPRPIHPKFPRCITVREAARLHSYPDWFRFHRTIWHGFRQIGNSVPPLLGRAVASRVAEALGYKPQRPKRRLSVAHVELAGFTMKQAAAHFGVDASVIAPRTRRAVG